MPDVLTTDEVAELRRTTDELVAASRGVSDHNDVYELEPGHTAAEPRVRRIKTPHRQHPTYDCTTKGGRGIAMYRVRISHHFRQV